MGSNVRSDSTSSSASSIRTGSDPAGENTSTIPPRSAHWPTAVTVSTRSYPADWRCSTRASRSTASPGASVRTWLRNAAGVGSGASRPRAGTITQSGSPRSRRPRRPARVASSSRAPASRQSAACGTGIRTTSPGAFRPRAPAKARRSSRTRKAVGSSATTTAAGRAGGSTAASASDVAEPQRPSSGTRAVPRASAARAAVRSPQISSDGGPAGTTVARALALTAAPDPGGRTGSPARSTGRRSGAARPAAP